MGESNITTRTSQDGEKYKAKEAPCEVDLTAIEFIEHDLSDWDAFPVYHFYVTAKEISDKKLPLWEANPREPTITTPVKNMLRTLERQPEDFVKKIMD